MSLENYVSRSALWVNGKMTICPFATPIFSIKTGTLKQKTWFFIISTCQNMFNQEKTCTNILNHWSYAFPLSFTFFKLSDQRAV